MKKTKPFSVIIIVLVLLLVGCNSNDTNTNIQNTEETDESISETTSQSSVSYVKKGFYTPSESQSEELVYAVMNDYNTWQKNLDDEEIYFIEFADLNFDGNPEFIVCDTLYLEETGFHSNAYYLKDGHLIKADVINPIKPMDGYDNDYTAYFDKKNGEYIIIGKNYTNYSDEIIFRLYFDGETITIKSLLYKSKQKTQSDSQFKYYRFEDEVAVEIGEEEFNKRLSDLEENDDWVEVFSSPRSDTNIKFAHYDEAHPNDKKKMLKTALSNLSYDIYVQE